METSFGTQVPPPTGFNFLQDSSSPNFLPFSNGTPNFNINNKSSLIAGQSQAKTLQSNNMRDSKRLRKGISGDETHSTAGPLVANPERLGFSHLKHKRRELPRFLIGQHPQLKQRKFVQDSWDKANQQKMLQLEDSIDDITELYETLRKMRDMERKVMENKGLVDKADSAKDLTEAISFQGTCQDMCPVFERSRRNVEHTVFSYEKEATNERKASRLKALKVFARPAAAAAPPLPSDVRPPHILSQTLDYIIDNLLDTLPESEGFLWDRMRSIRQDFTYQNYSGPEAVDCNERIVRIHLLIIHIMGKSKGDFSLQQELEQLHKSLITLSEIYDEVRAAGGECPNEAEFRAYALLSKIRDPAYDKNIQELPQNIFQNEKVQMALCFRRIISNSNFNERGYMRTENCLNLYGRFFQLIKSGKLPFLLSSFLELYVNEVRFYAFKALSHSVNKRHKPISFKYLIDEFLFNDQQELEGFCDYYSISMTEEGVELKSLTHHSHKLMEKRPLKHAYLRCVDEMLNRRSYPELINSGKEDSKNNVILNDRSSLTMSQTKPMVEARIPKKSSRPEEEVSFIPIARPNDTLNSISFPTANKLNSLPKPFIPQHNEPILNNKSSRSFTKVENGPPTGQTHTPLDAVNNRKPDDESEKKLEEEKRKIELKAKRQRSCNEVSKELASDLVKNVVHEEISKIIQEFLQKDSKRKGEIQSLAQGLYQAFLHEKLYQIYLESKADVFHNKKVENQKWSKWRAAYKSIHEKRELEKKRKAEIKDVARLLGVPNCKKSKLMTTPRSSNMSFILSSSARKEMTYSPVADETNKFLTLNERKKDAWEPFNLKEIFFNELDKKCQKSGSISKADVFIYGKNWSSVSNSWVMNKFDICNKNSPVILKGTSLEMTISCIDSNYDPANFDNVQLLVFNTGVTDSNIFDLEMKLQQDGEELIKLVTGVSLNTNLCFDLVILYWESTETPLDDSTICKYLKLNRISKSFNSVIENLSFININGNAPHKELQKGLEHVSHRYKFKLTDRGKYNSSLLKRRSLAGICGQKGLPDATKDIDTKMKKLLEQEQSKHEKELDDKNTYAHLKHHIAASPKGNKRKLPVLLSKAKENNFKTPLAKRCVSSYSPAITSHLVTKFRRDPHSTRYQRSLAPGTPTHCNNVPEQSATATTSLLANAPETSTGSNTSFERPMIIREPALFRTPINSTTSNESPSLATTTHRRDIPESLVELKALIDSVKKKVNNS